MNRKPYRNARVAALLALSLGASSAHAAGLEEVVARGLRPDIGVEQIRFEATMNAYANRVGAELKHEMRKQIAEQARPRLRVAKAGISHRG